MILEHDGYEQSHKEWAEDYGIPPRLILARLDCGWPVAAAIETPMEAPPGFKLGDPVRKLKSERGSTATVFIEHDGLKLSLTDWSQRLGISRPTISGRLRKGWPVADVLSKASFRAGPQPKQPAGGGKQLSACRLETGAPVTRKIEAK